MNNSSYSPTKEAEKICDRIRPLFKQKSRTRYWVAVVYYSPDDCYNLFFNTQRPRAWQRSWPIAVLKNIDLDQLIATLNAIHQSYHFTFEYRQFAGLELERLRREVL